MGKRQKAWARRETDRLRQVLGGCCSVCGTTDKLEFDVIIVVGNNDHHRKMDWSHRMSFYRKQHSLNNLQLLCKYHNGLKSDNPF